VKKFEISEKKKKFNVTQHVNPDLAPGPQRFLDFGRARREPDVRQRLQNRHGVALRPGVIDWKV
jgi:hypothetical protein